VGDANEALAESLGKTVEELTAEEKQMAILNEVLRSGDSLINQLGGSVESMVDPWDRLTAAIKNQTNALQASMTQASGFAGILNGISDGLDEGQVQLEIYSSKVEILDAALEAGIITEKEHAKALVKLSNTYQVLETDVGYYNDATEMAEAHTIAMKESVNNAAIAAANYYPYVDLATESTEELSAATITADTAMKSYGESLLFTKLSAELNDEQQLQLARSLGMVDEKTVYATTKMGEFNRMLGEGSITVDEYNALVLGLKQSLEGLPSDVPINVNMIINGTGDVDRYLSSLNRSVTIPVNFQIQNNIPQTQATGGQVYKSRPAGGTVSGANPYLWQEYGYRGEVFIPGQNGYVLSRADAKRIVSEAANEGGGKGGNTYNIYVTGKDELKSDVADTVRLLEMVYS
jgi:hypothetical protein